MLFASRQLSVLGKTMPEILTKGCTQDQMHSFSQHGQITGVTTLNDNPSNTCISKNFILEALWSHRDLSFGWRKLLF